MANLIEIRPIDATKWHGKKGAESFARPKKLKALVDRESLEYATGLSEEEEKEYSKKMGQDLSRQFKGTEMPHPFWDSNIATLELPNYPIFLNLDNPIEFIKLKFAKVSRYVANSMGEVEKGMYPEATHVIFDQEEEMDIKASKIAFKKKLVLKTAEISDEKKAELILLVDGKLLKGKSSNTLEVALDKLIQNKPKEVLRYLEMDLKDRSMQALVLEALHKNILRKEGHKIFYYDNYIGGDTIDVALYLINPDNQDLKLRIMKALAEGA